MMNRIFGTTYCQCGRMTMTITYIMLYKDKEIEINRNSIITNIILLNVLNCYNYAVSNYAALIAQLI